MNTATANGHDIPYSSQEARTRAVAALDAGRRSAADKSVTAPSASPIDELLFSVGQHREGQTADIGEAHRLIPPLLAPRRRASDTVEDGIARRLRIFLRAMERRIRDLLEANNRELERRREAERHVARLEQENEDLGEELRRRALRVRAFPTVMVLDDLEAREIAAGMKTKDRMRLARVEALDSALYAMGRTRLVRARQEERDLRAREALSFLKNNWNLLPPELRNDARNFIRYENEGGAS
ncbi:hypothetical protein FHS78_000666 [Parvibaculum indicum]|uniref:hypothetical protein n=1 Tax=Parvibaculum indicum TaxID=562969 RepID=UPI00141DAF16|nr:hypothetical protein [Parvibaculum indicum]NIJ40396.1 hypothetical protein [Parvibaculum indicum]